MTLEFWDYLQQLVETSEIAIDRPKGSFHPRYPRERYPVDYGYLKNTTSIDSSGVDIWVGSLRGKNVVGVLCTVDLLKRDTELKIICDCTEKEIQAIENLANTDQMRAICIQRESEKEI
jgi:inorganic pyrophosphatase